jgi:hypothetical protein
MHLDFCHCDEQTAMSGVFPSHASCLFSSRRAGVSCLARYDERGVPVSRVLSLVIATSGVFPSRALRRAGRSRLAHLDVCHRDERGFPVSCATTSGAFPSRASYQIIELGEK